MEADSSTAATSGSASGMARMPVELTLTVGTVTLPLARLLEMSEGQTLMDEVTSYFPRVRLHAGDRLVAEGDLVRVDGRIGFRVGKILA